MQNTRTKSVDIILPVYNSEKFIEQTLDHIFSNDYNNFKVIVSDDCSKDNTVKIVRKYQEKHPNKIILNVNGVNIGIMRNADLCLALTTGDIVMFGAHDDLFYKDKISKCVECFDVNQSTTLVYHDCDVIVDEKKIMKYSDTHQPREGGAWNYLVYGCFSTGPSVCMVGDVARQVGYRKEAGPVSDFLLFYEVAKRGGVKYIPEVLGAYVRHGNNLSSSLRQTEDFNSIKASLFILEEYPEDRIPALINFQWAMIRLLYRNKHHLFFYLISPVLVLFWLLGLKIGKKKIP